MWAMGGCFHPDATYRFAAIDGTWQEFVNAARAVIDPLRISHHQTGNMLIRVMDDTAHAETYFTAYHRIPWLHCVQPRVQNRPHIGRILPEPFIHHQID